MREKINSELEIITKPLPQDDPLQRKPIIDLARKELGWEPKIILEEGLLPTIEWFKQSLGRKA